MSRKPRFLSETIFNYKVNIMAAELYNIFISILLVLDIGFIIAIIFLERKNPASSIAWILVIIILPGLGVLAYLMLGSGFHITKKKRYNLKALNDDLNDNFIEKHINLDNTAELREGEYGRVVSFLQNTGSTCSRHNQAEVFADGESFFNRMKQDLRAAQKHIHLLYYIFRNDELGQEILSILEEKAAQGVEVRVIYDSLGSMLTFGSMFKKLRKQGGQAFAFEPFLFTLSSHLRLNYRNHRKITVVDGTIAYVGGMNIGVEYLGQHKKLTPWRDTQLRLNGPAVWFLQKRFLMDWCYVSDQEFQSLEVQSFFPRPIVQGDIPMQIVNSGPDTGVQSPIKGGLLGMIQAARRNIYIQTPYFTPDEGFLECLRIAALAGADVRLMLPGEADYAIVHYASLGYARALLASGARVYLYNNGFMHAKTVTIDGEVASIGTCNIGYRSFNLNFEVNAFIYDPAFTGQHEQIFLHDQENSIELTADWFNNRGILNRAMAGLARLASPLM